MNIERILHNGYWHAAEGDMGDAAGGGGGEGTAGGEVGGEQGGTAGGEQGGTAGGEQGGSTGGEQGGAAGGEQGGESEAFLSQVPEDWRKQIAGEDEKQLKWLERYQSLDAAVKAGFEAQDKIRRGEMSSGLPENPTEEQLTEWRANHGIPESPDGYSFEYEEGVTFGEADSRIFDAVGAVAYKHNIPQDAMQDMTAAMMKAREHEAQAQVQQDNLDMQTANAQLHEVWGGDFDTNVSLVKNWLTQTMPADVAELVAGARLPNGKAMFNSPEVMMGLAAAARELNPAATVVPGASNPTQAIDSELDILEKKIGTDEWWGDQKMQQRYRELLETKEKMTAKG